MYALSARLYPGYPLDYHSVLRNRLLVFILNENLWTRKCVRVSVAILVLCNLHYGLRPAPRQGAESKQEKPSDETEPDGCSMITRATCGARDSHHQFSRQGTPAHSPIRLQCPRYYHFRSLC